jgi:hypothetical protein
MHAGIRSARSDDTCRLAHHNLNLFLKDLLNGEGVALPLPSVVTGPVVSQIQSYVLHIQPTNRTFRCDMELNARGRIPAAENSFPENGTLQKEKGVGTQLPLVIQSSISSEIPPRTNGRTAPPGGVKTP